MVNADAARTPTLAMFARPDYFLSSGSAACAGSCVTQNPGFAWDPGDYAAEINTNFLGLGRSRGQRAWARRLGPRCGPELGRGRQRPEDRARQRNDWYVGGRDRHPADAALAGRAARRLPVGRPGDQRGPHAARRDARRAERRARWRSATSSSTRASAGSAPRLCRRHNAVESTSAGDEAYLDTAQALAQLEGARDTLAGQIKGSSAPPRSTAPRSWARPPRPSPARPSSRPRHTWRRPADPDAQRDQTIGAARAAPIV